MWYVNFSGPGARYGGGERILKAEAYILKQMKKAVMAMQCTYLLYLTNYDLLPQILITGLDSSSPNDTSKATLECISKVSELENDHL